MIPFDYHSHHYRCGHATRTMRNYIDQAITLGMRSFGVSDHGPAYFIEGVDHAFPGTQMAVSELPAYVKEAIALKGEYAPRIDVRVGIEADFVEGKEEELAALLAAHPFDYVLGSVHYAYGRSIFARERWAEEEPELVWRDHYRLEALAARSGMFDILSHLTAVEAYSPPLPDSLAAELYPPVADAVAESGCIVEINTSGYRKMGGDEPFPDRRMLRLLRDRGVPLTFGADSHRPPEVGFARDRVLSLLKELGIRTEEPTPVTVRRGALWAYRTM